MIQMMLLIILKIEDKEAARQLSRGFDRNRKYVIIKIIEEEIDQSIIDLRRNAKKFNL